GGRIGVSNSATPWLAKSWPIGGLVAACLAASEGFKSAMRRLEPHARSVSWFRQQYGRVTEASVDIAPSGTPTNANVGPMDIVSGRAISNSLLYPLLRVPNVQGASRIVEFDVSDITNLNRNMLLTRSMIGMPKALALARFGLPRFNITPCIERFDEEFP